MTGGVILLGVMFFCWRWELFQDSGGLLDGLGILSRLRALWISFV